MQTPPEWEYAHVIWERGLGKERAVEFSHRPRWDRLRGAELPETLHRLEADGYELIGQHTLGSEDHDFWYRRPLRA